MAYKKPPQIRPKMAEGTNRKVLQHALAPIGLPRIDTKDTAAVEHRVNDYLLYCMDNDLCPSVSGCANWLGVSVRCLEYWYTGQRGNVEHQRIATAFYGVLQEIWFQDLWAGRVNPVSAIFVGKCFFGYRDSVELVVKQPDTEQQLSTAELIAEAKRLEGK